MRSAFTVAMAISMLSIGQGLKMATDDPPITVSLDNLPGKNKEGPDAWLTVDLKKHHKDVAQLQKLNPERRIVPNASEDFMMVEITHDDWCVHDFWAAVGPIKSGSRQEPGVLAWDAVQIEGYPFRFMVHEVYENEAKRRVYSNRPYYRHFYEFMHSDCAMSFKHNNQKTAFMACEAPLSDHLKDTYGCDEGVGLKQRVDPDAWLTVDLKRYYKDAEELQKLNPGRRIVPNASEDFMMVEITPDDWCVHDFWAAVGPIKSGSRQEPGVLAWDAVQIEGYSFRFMVHEVYENEARRRLYSNRPYYRHFYEFMHSDCAMTFKHNNQKTAFMACEAPLGDHLKDTFGCPED